MRKCSSCELFLGIDVGTSGVRAIAIGADGVVHGQSACAMPRPVADGVGVTQDPALWLEGVRGALSSLLASIDRDSVRAIAVDGTSGTFVLSDGAGVPLTPGFMYNDARAVAEAGRVRRIAPPASAAHGVTSPLARLLHLQQRFPQARHVQHQADWISGHFCGLYGVSDENNALKLGYDPVLRGWPDWFADLGVQRSLLPRVVVPGTVLGRIDPRVAAREQLPADVAIVAGTTDGVAAFLASGARNIGDAVSSLGSTLVVKVLSPSPLFVPEHGIYSHRIGELWLPGGASNTGGDALLKFFSAQAMHELTARLQPQRATGFDYYPLPGVGERFPVNDPQLLSRTLPRPADDGEFFQALLEGIGRVEQLAYRCIASFGAPYPASVRTVGGGAANSPWTAIRARLLGVPMLEPTHRDAAYGAALLARRGVLDD
jgi:D-ribulokinase